MKILTKKTYTSSNLTLFATNNSNIPTRKRKFYSSIIIIFFLSTSINHTYGRITTDMGIETGETSAIYATPESRSPSVKSEEYIKELRFSGKCSVNAYKPEGVWDEILNPLFFRTLGENGYQIERFKGVYGDLVSRTIEDAGFITFKGNEVTISFHGTASPADWSTDFNALPTTASYLDIKGKVHKGFLKVFQSSWENTYGKSGIRELILNYAKQTGHDPKYLRYKVNGHSLGGALATLTAIKLVTDKAIQAENDSVSLTTFASPRIFNEEACRDYESKIKADNRLEFVVDKDIFPSLPPLYTSDKARITLSGNKSWINVFGNHSMVNYKELIEDMITRTFMRVF
ncbi:MAG: lipase family protein [Alphaproteobacteria bacterium]|nr:lipase family protein [Alphaproteobacteria bacterium]